MKNLRRYIASLLPVLLLLTHLAENTSAALLDVGPVVPEMLNSSPPQHGYPLWYRDLNRVPMELCLSQAVSLDPAAGGGTMCNLLPGPGFDPALEIKFPTNFPDEVFWWSGDTQIRNDFIRARLIMAIEGAWATGDITSGKQIAFNRIRFMVDTPVAGTYRIIFPYGERTFYNVPAGVHAIFHTEDIGVAVGKFDGALQGGVGPFLSWDSGVPITVGTEQFVGDPNIEHTVTGSPFGTNYFRVEGPAGSNLDGLGNNFVQTNLFAITGKLLQQPIPTPLKGDKVTYAREGTSAQVSVFTTSQPVSNVTNTLAPYPANFSLLGTFSTLQSSGVSVPTIAMTTNDPADGKFFSASGLFADPGTIPDTVSVTNTADIPPTTVAVPLVDEVMISKALFQPLNNILAISAASSDKVALPALQAFMPGMTAPIGTLAGGTLTVAFPFTDSSVTPPNTFAIPPMTVTVRSFIGGEATVPVVMNSKVPPVANNDAAGLDSLAGTTAMINVLANDTATAPATIAPATLRVVALPAHGTASAAAGTITYTLTQPGFIGTDTFTYMVQDSLGSFSNVATASVTINNPPVANADAATTPEDTAVVINVVSNDTDPNAGDAVVPASVLITAQPVNGTAAALGDGTVRYTPNLNFNGSDSFQYTVRDTFGAVSNAAAAVTITIAPVADPPLAANDTATTAEDLAVVINVVANDTHPDIGSTVDPATLAVVAQPANGTAVANLDGTVTYTPALNFNGANSFTYTVKDNLGATSNTATVSITVTPVNDPPAAVNDTATTPENTAVTLSVTANDADVDGNLAANSVVIGTLPTSGTAVANPDGSVTYTPNLNFFGTDSFTYTVKDTSAAVSNVATATITVTQVFNPPVANNDAATTAEDTAVTFGVTANDTGVDGTVVVTSLAFVALPANGTVVDKLDGTVTYTPNPNFSGTDTFTYTVRDSNTTLSNVATATVTVTPVNDPPVAVNDVAATTANSARIISVIANDTDIDGTIAANTVVIAAAPANGAAVPNADGTVTYTPAANYVGTDTFTYSVNDNGGATSNTATVSVSVSSVVTEIVNVRRAQYQSARKQWLVEGTTTNSAAGRTITIRIGRDLTGPIVDTTTVAAGGKWRFQLKGAATPVPDATSAISVQSSGGGARLAFPLAIR